MGRSHNTPKPFYVIHPFTDHVSVPDYLRLEGPRRHQRTFRGPWSRPPPTRDPTDRTDSTPTGTSTDDGSVTPDRGRGDGGTGEPRTVRVPSRPFFNTTSPLRGRLWWYFPYSFSRGQTKTETTRSLADYRHWIVGSRTHDLLLQVELSRPYPLRDSRPTRCVSSMGLQGPDEGRARRSDQSTLLCRGK